ncbi:hypothetical protein NQZ68_016605 [Dissostichus eleginoides]|nr:hypothetical protein NQZ68_016605 [Dissostichus eleginoides]
MQPLLLQPSLLLFERRRGMALQNKATTTAQVMVHRPSEKKLLVERLVEMASPFSVASRLSRGAMMAPGPCHSRGPSVTLICRI